MRTASSSLGLVLAAFLVLSASCVAADTVRVCTYNVLAYTASNEDGRIPLYRTVLRAIDPDILVCQEVGDATMGPRFVNEVLNTRPFAASPFIDGPDSDNQIFYDQNKFTLLGQRMIATTLRNIAEYTLVTVPTGNEPADTLVIYSMHLKATNDAASTAQRGREIETLQSEMTTHRYAIVAGDLNIYSTSEPAYLGLIKTPTVGRRFVDPLMNTWVRNDTKWLKIYTQCPRRVQIPACGGGVDGGLDDRFDYQMASVELAPRVLVNTVTAFGNDGQDRRAAAINDPENTIVSKEIADALLCAADHLPVYTDYVLGSVPASVNEPFDATHGLRAGVTYHIYDVQGRLVASQTAEADGEPLQTATLTTGLYIVTDGTRAGILPK